MSPLAAPAVYPTVPSATRMLLAFGSSQLAFGPLSDRFGRRPVLLGGLAAYVVAAVGSAMTPSITWGQR